jgi:sodium-dependent phosphate transporter
MARLEQYNYVFAIGTFFAMLDAYNNGASMSLGFFDECLADLF